MNSLSELKNDFVTKLKSDARLNGIRVIAEYPSTGRDYPLTKPAVAVSIDSAELSGAWADF